MAMGKEKYLIRRESQFKYWNFYQGNPTIDYFSLDVEGSELQILETIPWSEVKVNVFTIEFNGRKPDQIAMTKLLEDNGFKFLREISHQDLLFVHNRIVDSLPPEYKLQGR